MASITSTRRSLLGAIAIAPMVVAAPAVAALGPPSMDIAVKRYELARDRLNNSGDISEEQEDALFDIMCDEQDAVEEMAPQTALDFVRKFTAVWDDKRNPGEEMHAQMLREARVLIGKAAR